MNGDATNKFAVHYPQVSRQKSVSPAFFLLSILIAIVFALKQLRKPNTRVPVLLTSQLDLTVIQKIVSMTSKLVVRNIFFLLSHFKQSRD